MRFTYFNPLQQQLSQFSPQQQSQQPKGIRGVLLTALSLGYTDESVSPILPISTLKEPLHNRSEMGKESLPPKRW